MTEAAFETLPLPNKAAPLGMGEGTYKIYKTAEEMIFVKAKSALEAIKNSGVDNIYRVERDSLDKNYLLSLARGSEIILGVGGDPAAAPAAPEAAAAAAAPAAPAAEAPKA